MSLNWDLDPLVRAPDADLSTPERKFSSQRMEAGRGDFERGSPVSIVELVGLRAGRRSDLYLFEGKGQTDDLHGAELWDDVAQECRQ
jgi:hypothetical protein